MLLGNGGSVFDKVLGRLMHLKPIVEMFSRRLDYIFFNP
jgi:hypothetical protein